MVVPFGAQFLSTRNASPHEDAVRLGRLRRRKQGDLVLDALRIIEPRLRSIEDSVASGAPMISGDIGLSELVPLAVMGEGMIRIARLVLAVVDSPDGLVLVDEVETGLHHSVLPEVWKAVDAVARRFGTQIVATTHSYECMQAAGGRSAATASCCTGSKPPGRATAASPMKRRTLTPRFVTISKSAEHGGATAHREARPASRGGQGSGRTCSKPSPGIWHSGTCRSRTSAASTS